MGSRYEVYRVSESAPTDGQKIIGWRVGTGTPVVEGEKVASDAKLLRKCNTLEEAQAYAAEQPDPHTIRIVQWSSESSVIPTRRNPGT